MRRSFFGLDDTQLDLSDVLLSLRNLQRETSLRHDHVNLAYSVINAVDSIRDRFVLDYTRPLTDTFCDAAFQLNDVSGQPLSLSLVDSARSDLPSWTPDWTRQSARFLLNHAGSTFSASPHAVCSYRALQLPNTELAFPGLVVDVVQHCSSYLPPRRHCDHYAVSSANSYFFSEWNEFARAHSPAKRSAHLVSLAYADTMGGHEQAPPRPYTRRHRVPGVP
jgi:hypothetical protein